MALLSAQAMEIAIPVCAVIGITYSLVWWFHTSRNLQKLDARCDDMLKAIDKGVKAFPLMEYPYVVLAFAILIFLCLGSVESFNTQSRPCTYDPSNTCKPALATAVFTTVSFLLGACTSVLSRFLGMKIAIYAYVSAALESRRTGRTSIAAFRPCAIMGILLAANGLLVLCIAMNLFKLYYGNDWRGLCGALTGYGLGGSFMALIGRACGGIYAKAADACGEIYGLGGSASQDDRNPSVITDNVGDIVGDIAGMGTDLFGSYAESSCAALIAASIPFGIDHDFTAMYYPLLISSMGILVCLITTHFTDDISKIEDLKKAKSALRKQLIISTILMTVGIGIVSWIALPSSFTVYDFGSQKVVKNWQLVLCVDVGLWAALAIAFVNKLYTPHDIRKILDAYFDPVLKKIPVFDLLKYIPHPFANIPSFGLRLVKIPIFTAIIIFVSHNFAALYGIVVAAVGMLSTIATRLAIDACGPIGNNAKHIGKVFAIESTALVSIALFGAFGSCAAILPVDTKALKFVIGLSMGVMLTDRFYAMTVESAGRVGSKMALQASWQIVLAILGDHEAPDFGTCVKISTHAAIRGMISPCAIAMLTPLIVGTFFGAETLYGVLTGSLSFVFEVALEHAKAHSPELLEDANSVIIGDTLKDTSLTPLNNLIKLMAIESLVFAPFFTAHGGLLFKYI